MIKANATVKHALRRYSLQLTCLLFMVVACEAPNTLPELTTPKSAVPLVFTENILEDNQGAFELQFTISDAEDEAKELSVSVSSSDEARVSPSTTEIDCLEDGNCTLKGQISRLRAAEVKLTVLLLDTRKGSAEAEIVIKIEPRFVPRLSLSLLQETIEVAQEGDVVAFEPLLFLEPQTLSLNEEWLINKDVGIRGPGPDKFILDAQGLFRHFRVETGKALLLDGVHLTNGKAQDDAEQGSFEPLGGSIFNRGKLTLRNSRISKSQATSGAAIYSLGADARVTIEESSLIGGSSLTEGNKAERSGGAVFNEGGTVRISNSKLNFNSSLARAGAIFSLGDDAMVELDSSSASNNASKDGGAIKSEFGTVIIKEGSVIANNVASEVEGGGIFMTSGKLEIRDSSIMNNEATVGAGGGIYSFECDPEFSEADACTAQNKDASVLIDNSKITSNRARAGGGIAHELGLLTIENGAIFEGNEAQSFGGGVFARGDVVIAEGVVIRENIADSNQDTVGVGGGVFMIGDTSGIAQAGISDNQPDDLAVPPAAELDLWLELGLDAVQSPRDR